MAKNDMEVIEYKILAYLYESLRAGHTTALEEGSVEMPAF